MFWKVAGVAVYLAILLGIGVVASRRVGDLADYFASGKNLGFWSVAFSSRATGESGWLLLGLTGMGAAYGFRGFWVVLGEVLGVCGAWLLMARRFNRLTRKYGDLTIPDYLTSRFRDPGHGLRLVSAIALVVFVTIYVSAQIDATGAAFESFLGTSWGTGVLVGFGVVMAYSVSGGFTAVVWSDVFQGALMVVGLVALPIVGLSALGGWTPMVRELFAIDPSLLDPTGGTGWTAATVASTAGLALIGLGFMGSPQVFARFLALRDEAEIAKGAWVAFVWTVLADSGAVIIGMVGRVLLDRPGVAMIGDGNVLGKGGQDVLPLLVEHLLPGALVGLYIAIVLSAIMSTVDSLLVLASSAAVRDVYQQVLNPDLPDDALVRHSRTATLALGLAALAVATGVAMFVPGRTVFWFVIFGWSGIAATFCPTMILSLFWERMTREGALAAMIVGFLGVPFFKFLAPDLPRIGWVFGALEELPPSFALSLLVGVLVSLVTEPPDIGDDLAEAAR
ncbi:MAG: sodium/proline symporter [Myxococcales bacterium]|nr:sodium/proline symporter [Myxococcales bacterium]